MVVVVKFGGKTLETAAAVTEAAKGVFSLSQSNPVVVVVSARGETTNRLYDEIASVNPGADPEILEPYLLTGETQSVYVFVAALRALGAKAYPVLPSHRSFPVRVALKPSKAPAREKVNEVRAFKVLWKSSRAGADKLRQRLQRGFIPVVAGFAGRTKTGKMVTLGRGGSDITAFILARLLKAREVILVKDVEGVLSADPRLLAKGRKVRTLSREALANLIAAGSQVLHPATLRFLSEQTRVRFGDRALSSKAGTEVLGDPYFDFKHTPEIVSAITVIGHGFSQNPSVIGRLLSPLEAHHIRVVGTALLEDDLTIYVPDALGEEAYILLSREATQLPQVTTTHLKKNLARLVVEHRHILDDTTDVIRALRALRSEHVTVHGVLLLPAEFHIFIPSEDLSRAQTCLHGLSHRNRNEVSTASH